MNNKQFENIILKDKDLNSLLNDKRIFAFSNFTNKEIQTPGFKEYIEERYKHIFNEIYNDTSEKNNIFRNAIIRTLNYLATDDFKEKIVEELKEKVNLAFENFKIFKNDFDKNFSPTSDLSLTNLTHLDSIFDSSIVMICNNFDNVPEIKEKKDLIVNECLLICQKIHNAKVKTNVNKYMVYNVIMNNLVNFRNLNDSQKQSFEYFDQKINKKRDEIDTKYYIYVGITIILIIFKILRYYSRN